MMSTATRSSWVDADLRAASKDLRTIKPRPEVAVHLRCVGLCLAFFSAALATAAETWLPVRWHDEAAYELQTTTWRAIISVERGRLVHVGPAASETNLLFAPATKDGPTGWGGHRVWLGPQNTWTPFWPPPAAWERSAAETATLDGARLTLVMPATGNGWPRLTRIYELVDGQLACRIALGADGTRDAQIMQILQTHPSDNLTVPIVATPESPLGCMLLPPFQGRRDIVPLTEPLDYMARTNLGLEIHLSPRLDKIAFPPQTLIAHFQANVLRVARGASLGEAIGAPDRGFYTQICPGQEGPPIVELEQMSPLYRAGQAAEFTMLVEIVPE